jgi:hypothetical protein
VKFIRPDKYTESIQKIAIQQRKQPGKAVTPAITKNK